MRHSAMGRRWGGLVVGLAIGGSTLACESSNDATRAVRDGAQAAAGQLSESTQHWLRTASESDTVERLIATGTQVGPIASEIGVIMSETVHMNRGFEPIYQTIAAGDEDAVDAAIARMPRTEVIEGVTVGFKQLATSSNEEMVNERAYLITWRRDSRLIGFVYRSKRTIDLNKLVNDAPRLLNLANQAAKSVAAATR